ncbi:hypothetical protein D9M71_446950 [compost metagenome]
MTVVVGALHLLAEQVGQVADNRALVPAVPFGGDQHFTGRARGGQTIVAEHLHVVEALRRHFVGTRRIGADGGDQRRFAQARRIDHRTGGRGAEHDHVGVLNGSFAAVDDVQAWLDVFQQAHGFGIFVKARRVQADALPVAQAFHVVQVRLGHFTAADDGQTIGCEWRQGVDRHGGGGRRARGGQFSGIAQQQRLAGLHRHQQRPCSHQRPLFTDDVR